MNYRVSIKKLAEEFNLRNLTENISLSNKYLTCPEINRPALQLAGFFDLFDNERLQILGLVEHTFASKMDENIRSETIRTLFEYKIPCMVVCRSLPLFPEMLGVAYKTDIPILSTQETTSDFMGEVIKWLKVELAPRITIHGVLVDICGEGILIIGESGIGKSETALELLKRGHRLVADDSVEIKKVSNQTLLGSCPDVIRYFMELRGIGIVDIKQMFGVESVKMIQSIDLVIKLEEWEERKEYDRLGMEETYIELLGNRVVCHYLPIRPGRNIAIICEAAAINHRMKKMGYNAACDLEQRSSKSFLK